MVRSITRALVMTALLAAGCGEESSFDATRSGQQATGGKGGTGEATDPANEDPGSEPPPPPPAEGKPGEKPGAGCTPPPPPPAANDPVKCWAEEDMDQVCKVCVDASGKEVMRACSGDTPPPPDPVKCEEVKTADQVCKVCYDAHGAVVAKECAR